MTIKIDVYKSKDLDLRGATVVDGFSSASIIGSIVANYLVEALILDQISVLDSDDFPPVSIVSESKPKYPASPTVKIDVEPLYREAQKIEDWIKEQHEPSQMFG